MLDMRSNWTSQQDNRVMNTVLSTDQRTPYILQNFDYLKNRQGIDIQKMIKKFRFQSHRLSTGVIVGTKGASHKISKIATKLTISSEYKLRDRNIAKRLANTIRKYRIGSLTIDIFNHQLWTHIEGFLSFLIKRSLLKIKQIQLIFYQGCLYDLSMFTAFSKSYIEDLVINMKNFTIYKRDELVKLLRFFSSSQSTIRKISLTVENAEVPSTNLTELATTLKTFKNLQELNCSFILWNPNGDVPYGQFVSASGDLFRMSDNLRSLAFGTDFVKVSSNSFLELLSGLKARSELICLSLDMKKFENLDNALFDEFAKTLLAFPLLGGLSIDISECPYITDEATTNFPILFGRLPQLKSFTFSCSRNNITDGTIQNISESIIRRPNLDKLCLDFKEDIQIGDKGLTTLGESIRKLTQLKKLDLNFAVNFSGVSGVGSQGFVLLMQSLVTQKELIRLSLDFTSGRISDDDALVIVNYLKYPKKLKQLKVKLCQTDVKKQTRDEIVKSLSFIKEREILI